jgi:UDP-N-acetylmuramate--alanine ligase
LIEYMRVFKHIKHIYFTGIGGIGMSGLADILIESGYQVSGSDRVLSDITDYLADRGAVIYEGHDAKHMMGVDLLVYSSAVPPDNPERKNAQISGIPQIRRAEMLAELMRLNYGIAIAGTHGKTTTTSMCAEILTKANLDPTIVVGGRFQSSLTNARLGKGDFFVTEADEYDRSFLSLSPAFAVITSIEEDHLDCYKDMEDIRSTFIEFAQKIPFYGSMVVCSDDEGVKSVIDQMPHNMITYGIAEAADYMAKNISFEGQYSQFDLFHDERLLGKIKLNVPGEHNIKNAMAAAIIGLEIEIPLATIQTALHEYSGVERRFEIRCDINDILVIDDYAHHPTEVMATLNSARSGYSRRIIAVFQPHLFSRTRDFYPEFAKSLDMADVIYITDIYPAREEPIPNVSGKLIFEEISKERYYIASREKLAREILKVARPNDMIVIMGAGDIWKTGNELKQLLTQM